MFASKTRKDIKVGQETITIRKLSGYQLDLAKQEQDIIQAGSLRRMGGEILTALRSDEVTKVASNLKKKGTTPDDKLKYIVYHRNTVLHHGIVAWSAGEVTDEQIRDLEEGVTQKVFEAIVDLTLPSKEEREEKATKRG